MSDIPMDLDSTGRDDLLLTSDVPNVTARCIVSPLNDLAYPTADSLPTYQQPMVSKTCSAQFQPSLNSWMLENRTPTPQHDPLENYLGAASQYTFENSPLSHQNGTFAPPNADSTYAPQNDTPAAPELCNSVTWHENYMQGDVVIDPSLSV